jgi:hypothetical protein
MHSTFHRCLVYITMLHVLQKHLAMLVLSFFVLRVLPMTLMCCLLHWFLNFWIRFVMWGLPTTCDHMNSNQFVCIMIMFFNCWHTWNPTKHVFWLWNDINCFSHNFGLWRFFANKTLKRVFLYKLSIITLIWSTFKSIEFSFIWFFPLTNVSKCSFMGWIKLVVKCISIAMQQH